MTTKCAITLVLQPVGSRRGPANRPFAAFDRKVKQRFSADEVVWQVDSANRKAFIDGTGLCAERVLDSGQLLNRCSPSGAHHFLFQPLSIFPRRQNQTLDCGTCRVEGRALIDDEPSAVELIHVLQRWGQKERPAVLVAHGRRGPIPTEIALFERVLARHWPQAVLVAIDGEPGFDPLHAAASRWSKQRVQVIPLMFTHGYHVQKDILAEDGDSVRARLLGCDLTCAPPMTDIEEVSNLWLKRIAWGRHQLMDHAGERIG